MPKYSSFKNQQILTENFRRFLHEDEEEMGPYGPIAHKGRRPPPLDLKSHARIPMEFALKWIRNNKGQHEDLMKIIAAFRGTAGECVL